MEFQLSVIIINYNGVIFLENCIKSIYTYLNGIKYEIIVWDNASTDNSCSLVEEKFNTVKLIKSPVNYGFGKGNNEAVKQAKGKYLLLLNNDTILMQPLHNLIQLIEHDPKIGLIGIKMLNGNKDYVPSVGRFPTWDSLLKLSRMSDKRKVFKTGDFMEEIYEVDWLSGSFLLTSKENFEKVNGFDTDYFMYVEDVDLSKKYKEIGLKNIFCSKLSYIHFVGFNPKKNHLLIKGYKLYIQKHFKGIYKLLALFVIKINSSVKMAKGNYA